MHFTYYDKRSRNVDTHNETDKQIYKLNCSLSGNFWKKSGGLFIDMIENFKLVKILNWFENFKLIVNLNTTPKNLAS